VPELAGNLIALSFLLLACQDPTAEVVMNPTSGVSSNLSSGLDPISRADMTLNTPTPPAEGPSPSQNQPHWQLTHWVEDTQTVTLAPEAEISLDWEQRQMSGYGGCNRFRATYRLEGDRVIVDFIESTRRACKGLIMEQETRFFTVLSQVSQITLANNDQLTLTYGEETVAGSLVFSPR
jgi:heat shock protein HslJ